MRNIKFPAELIVCHIVNNAYRYGVKKLLKQNIWGKEQRVFYLSQDRGRVLLESFFTLTGISWNRRRVTVSDWEEALSDE